MKKTLLLFSILLISCTTSDSLKKKDALKTNESIFNQKEVEITQQNFEEYLIGTWEAEDLGVILDQYGYSLPARLTFYSNQSYSWEYMNNGVRTITSGKYQITEKGRRPYRISLNQEKEVSPANVPIGKKPVKEMNGIFDFTKAKKLKTVFYDKDFIPRVEEFQELDIQIYRKIKK